MTYLKITYTRLTIGLLTLCIVACGEVGLENELNLYVTGVFINETSEPMIGGCVNPQDSVILPGDTLIREQGGNFQSSKKITFDNTAPSLFSRCPFEYVRGESRLCDEMMSDIINYENVKEIREGVFEMTFRFTEERKANAQPCDE
ncbi:MAG: hypothetical protein ABJQ69_03645 [Ekhidna sp.]